MDLDTTLTNQMSHDSGNKHGKKALVVMNELRLRREFCDVIVRVEGRDIHAHKIVLASLCSYFMAMFTGDMKERNQNVVKLNDLEPTAVELLIQFAYTGKVLLDKDNVQSLLYASSFFQLTDVQNACEKFLMLQLHPSNCLGIHSLAVAHSCDELSEASFRFVRENFAQTVESDEFLALSSSQLERILADNDLKVECEEEVYFALMKWIKHEKNRGGDIAQLVSDVRLTLLSPEFLVDTVGKEEVILSNSAARCMLDDAKDFHVLPQRWVAAPTTPRCSKLVALATVGGMGSNGHSLDTVEFFYPHSSVVDYTKAPMTSKRSGLGVTMLDGKVYAMGGYDGVKFLNRYD